MDPVIRWLQPSELYSIYSATYWNNVEEEKKNWWIGDSG
jgi:hypothetical protein